MRRYLLATVAIAVLGAVLWTARAWWTPAAVEAAPAEQGLLQLPLEFYSLVNQRSDLWLVRANLRDIYLREIDLSDANLREADLVRANLLDANLSGANLAGAALSDADLRRANLAGADLTGTNLARADLRGADLTGAILDQVNLNNARYDAETLWPEGFDAAGTNARLVEPAPGQ